jgi:carboxyl-terminal processing protease
MNWWLAGLMALALPASAEVLAPPPSSFDTFSQLAEFLQQLEQHYVEPGQIHPATHTTATLRAFLRAVDPAASLLTPAELTALDEPGVGLTLTLRDAEPTILTPHDGSPAQRAGLLPGERITGVDGRPVAGLSRGELTARLHGPAGSTIVLTVSDPATRQPRPVPLSRNQPVPSKNDMTLVAAGVGYYRLAEFTPATVAQLRGVLAAPDTMPTQGLILDLRNNPGGSLNAAVAATGLFISNKSVVVTLAFPRATQRAPQTTHNPRPLLIPVALLVNAGTAAEAEVFAAALRDHQRARLVGATTAGCGRFVSQYRLTTGNLLELPVAYFETPNRNRFDRTGLAPDLAVSLPRDTERALARAGYGVFDWARNRANILATDRQFAAAMELLAK